MRWQPDQSFSALAFILRQKFHNVPNVICDRGFHRRRHPQRLVDTAEIVVGECKQYAAHRFSHFFEKALVKRVKRRICILTVGF